MTYIKYLGSYQPRNHPHPPTNSQKSYTLPRPHTQPKKGHIHQHPPTPRQKMLIRSHTHQRPTKKRSYPHKSSWKSMKQKIFHIHWLIKFIRNSGSPKYNSCKVRCQAICISLQYRGNGKSAAVINNFIHILTKNYAPFIYSLSHFHFTPSYDVLLFLLSILLLSIIFAATCTTL